MVGFALAVLVSCSSDGVSSATVEDREAAPSAETVTTPQPTDRPIETTIAPDTTDVDAVENTETTIDRSALDYSTLVTGEALPTLTSTQGDVAVGLEMPVVTGISFDGSPQVLEPTGSPQAIVFLAHWCPHCQNEVTSLQPWLDGGGLPPGTELHSVVTAIDQSRGNYPPHEWLEREGWSPSVIVDLTGVVADSFGLSAFPYWVFVDGEGRVAGRIVGGIEPTNLEDILVSLLDFADTTGAGDEA